jgi:hypothetical protein
MEMLNNVAPEDADSLVRALTAVGTLAQGDTEMVALASDIGLLQAAQALLHNGSSKVQEAAKELASVIGA